MLVVYWGCLYEWIFGEWVYGLVEMVGDVVDYLLF